MKYLFLIIFIVLLFYFYNKDNFWNDLPVSKNKLENSGIISNNFNILNYPKKYKIYSFDPYLKIDHIINFINYNNLNLNYNNFKYEIINSKSNINNFLVMYNKKRIIGILINYPIDIYFYNKIMKTNIIKYVIIDKNLNYKKYFNILFHKNIQKNINQIHKTFIFSRDKNKYPFNYLCKCRYYFKDLYNCKKNENYKYVSMYRKNDRINKYFDFYNNEIKKYKVYRIFNKNDFENYFNSINPYVYCLYEEFNNEILSIAVIKKNNNNGFIELLLSKNINFIENVCYICRNLGMTTLKCLNTMNNQIFIDKFNFKKLYNKYYHMYNYHLNHFINPIDFGLFGF